MPAEYRSFVLIRGVDRVHPDRVGDWKAPVVSMPTARMRKTARNMVVAVSKPPEMVDVTVVVVRSAFATSAG